MPTVTERGRLFREAIRFAASKASSCEGVEPYDDEQWIDDMRSRFQEYANPRKACALALIEHAKENRLEEHEARFLEEFIEHPTRTWKYEGYPLDSPQAKVTWKKAQARAIYRMLRERDGLNRTQALDKISDLFGYERNSSGARKLLKDVL